MGNSQFIISWTSPADTDAFGASVRFNVPAGVQSLASTSAGKWCTAANLLLWYAGQWVESSLTYFAAGGGQAQGWYWWHGSVTDMDGTYHPLGNPGLTGNKMELKLFQPSSSAGSTATAAAPWQATFRNITKGTTDTYTQNTAPVFARVGTTYTMFENGGNLDCRNYVDAKWGPLRFTSFQYYDQAGDTVPFTPSKRYMERNTPKSCCGGGKHCITSNTQLARILRFCTTCDATP
jgi:hypothetical protein